MDIIPRGPAASPRAELRNLELDAIEALCALEEAVTFGMVIGLTIGIANGNPSAIVIARLKDGTPKRLFFPAINHLEATVYAGRFLHQEILRHHNEGAGDHSGYITGYMARQKIREEAKKVILMPGAN